jgi:two-component system OmpR family response regulator
MATSPRLVCIVDGDETLRESMARAIRAEGHGVNVYGNAPQALESFARGLPDLVIFDVPASGLEPVSSFTGAVRDLSATLPLVALIQDGGVGAEALALLPVDDYLSKPFSLRELTPRVVALLKRPAPGASVQLNWEDRPTSLGPLTVDPLRLSAQWNGHDLALTVTEMFLLQSLVRRVGVVKTRDQLLQDVFPGRSGHDGLIERHIARLRQKFEAIAPGFDALESVHGAGYRYRAGPSVRRV